MEAKSGSIRVIIGNRWWSMSVVGGKSAPWLVWKSGHVLPGRLQKPGFRVDILFDAADTCLQEVYVREEVRRRMRP